MLSPWLMMHCCFSIFWWEFSAISSFDGLSTVYALRTTMPVLVYSPPPALPRAVNHPLEEVTRYDVAVTRDAVTARSTRSPVPRGWPPQAGGGDGRRSRCVGHVTLRHGRPHRSDTAARVGDDRRSGDDAQMKKRVGWGIPSSMLRVPNDAANKP